MVYCFCNDDFLNHKSNATSVAIQTMPTSCYAWQYMIYGNELIHVAIRSMATNKIAWQMVLLPRMSTVAITYDLSQRIKLRGK